MLRRLARTLPQTEPVELPQGGLSETDPTDLRQGVPQAALSVFTMESPDDVRNNALPVAPVSPARVPLLSDDPCLRAPQLPAAPHRTFRAFFNQATQGTGLVRGFMFGRSIAVSQAEFCFLRSS